MRFHQMLMAAAGQGGGGVSYDADAALYFAAVVTAGGAAVTDTRKGHLNTFILAEKAAGTWALTDDYWMLAAETATQSLVSLKQRRTATATSTFATDAGYTGNGTSTFYNTGFIPTAHGVAMTGVTNCRLGMYINTTMRMGSQTAVTTERLQFGRIAGAQVSTGVGSDLLSGSSAVFASPVRMMSVSRSGSTVQAYYRGSAAEVLSPSLGAALPGFALYIGAVNNNGSFASGVSTQCRFACVGAAMTGGQEASQNTNVDTYMTAIGANL